MNYTLREEQPEKGLEGFSYFHSPVSAFAQGEGRTKHVNEEIIRIPVPVFLPWRKVYSLIIPDDGNQFIDGGGPDVAFEIAARRNGTKVSSIIDSYNARVEFPGAGTDHSYLKKTLPFSNLIPVTNPASHPNTTYISNVGFKFNQNPVADCIKLYFGKVAFAGGNPDGNDNLGHAFIAPTYMFTEADTISVSVLEYNRGFDTVAGLGSITFYIYCSVVSSQYAQDTPN